MQNKQINAEILKSMTGTVAKIIGFSHDSDVADCAQEACLRAVEKVASFDETKGNYKNWCCTIAANVARNWRKASANRGHDSEGHADDNGECDQLVDTLQGADGRAEVARIENTQWLEQAMATLSYDDRIFIRLINDDMTQVEAGAQVGWSESVASRKRKEIATKMRSFMPA